MWSRCDSTCEIHEGEIGGLKSELDMAKQRIDDLIPEAAVPKELRPEFQELKEDVIQRLGGTKKIREMLAAAGRYQSSSIRAKPASIDHDGCASPGGSVIPASPVRV